ncbi:MAG: hypothetical protein N3D10_01480 [Candidatus Micrarchaeota archaeon]|nr:hypothetical protein [Candidatus Micrarchaeota archaeon]
MELPNIYNLKNYKVLIIIPIFLILLSLASIFIFNPIKLGIDFSGGIEIQMISKNKPDMTLLLTKLKENNYTVFSYSSEPNPAGYFSYLEISRSATISKAEKLKSDFFSKYSTLLYLELETFSNNSANNPKLEEYKIKRGEIDKIVDELFELDGKEKNSSNYSSLNALSKEVQNTFASIYSKENQRLREILSSFDKEASISLKERSATLSSDFINRSIQVGIISFILVTIAVFLIFRTFIPSLAVLAGAVADVIMALGLMSVFSIPLNLPSFATLLMLVGFSLDTDILLTMNLLKRSEGSLKERAYQAMKTGFTMSLSTIVAFLTLLIVAYITKIQLYFIIAVVAIGGLIGDLIATWAFNAIILMHYIEESEKKGKKIYSTSLSDLLFRN